MKKVLYVIIALVVVYFVLCLVGPKAITVERSIVVNADPAVVKNQLGDLKFFQEKWSPWTEKDPDMKVTYMGEMGKAGSGYSWAGNKEVGSGTMVVTSTEGDSVIQKLTFEGMGDSKTFYAVKPENTGSKITWGISFEVGFMGRAMMLFMNMDKMMGADFEKGLTKFKTEIESMPAPGPKYEITQVDWTEKTFVGKRGTYAFDKLSDFFGENYPKIFEELGKAKVEPTMAPSAIYFKWDDEKGEADCAAVSCVPNGTKIKGYETFAVPNSKVLQIAYYGAYEKSINAHLAMDAYMKANNLPMQTQVIEEYVTDPMHEKDTAKWLTNIYYVLPAGK